MKGMGCDIVQVTRIEEKIVGKRFLDKVYTENEQMLIARKGAHTAAGLWAAKEAVCKALGTGFVGYAARDIEICHKESGQPYIKLYRGAETAAVAMGIVQIHLSISHDANWAMAVAIAE